MDTDARQSREARSLAGRRVLLADDCPAQQRILSFVLKKAGMTVTLAANGQEVVQRAGRERFDVVLLDMQMPLLDGYQAAAQLRQQGFRGPMVALTAEKEGDDEARCRAAGCDAFLAKPVHARRLLELLAEQLAATPSGQTQEEAADSSLEKLLRQYVAGLGERMGSIRAAFTAQEWPALRELAHKTRGAAGMYGLSELAETAGLLEDAVREGQAPELIDELIAEMDALVAHEIAVRP